jgi:hypothetical protein
MQLRELLVSIFIFNFPLLRLRSSPRFTCQVGFDEKLLRCIKRGRVQAPALKMESYLHEIAGHYQPRWRNYAERNNLLMKFFHLARMQTQRLAFSQEKTFLIYYHAPTETRPAASRYCLTSCRSNISRKADFEWTLK